MGRFLYSRQVHYLPREMGLSGVKAGVEPKSLWETTRRGAFGRMAGGVHTLPDTWFSGDFEPDREKGYFSTALMRKDMGLATDLGRELDVPLPMANLAEQVLVEAVLRGWSDDPCTNNSTHTAYFQSRTAARQ